MCSCTQSILNAYRIILDGEMLVWDPVSERNLPFGTLKTAAGGEHDDQCICSIIDWTHRQIQ